MFVENTSAFLDSTSGFALDATYDPPGANASVKVIFDAEYADHLDVDGTVPAAVGLATDFPVGALDKQLVISGKTWIIRGREPIDDAAFVRLRLEG